MENSRGRSRGTVCSSHSSGGAALLKSCSTSSTVRPAECSLTESQMRHGKHSAVCCMLTTSTETTDCHPAHWMPAADSINWRPSRWL